MKIVEVIMVLWWFYLNSVLPSLTQKFESKDMVNFEKIIQISFQILFSSWILIFVLWILFRENLIEIIANRQYIDTGLQFNSSDAFLVVFAIVLFNFISLVFIYILIASKNQSRLLKINIIVTIVNIIWNIVLIPKYSFIWAWIITLFSQILLMILWYIYTKNIIKFVIPWKIIFKNIIFWTLIFAWGKYILMHYHIGLYFDVLVYGGGLFWIYILFLIIDFKRNKILEK
jgi:O-antigen/teichoic acid export membrane protein